MTGEGLCLFFPGVGKRLSISIILSVMGDSTGSLLSGDANSTVLAAIGDVVGEEDVKGEEDVRLSFAVLFDCLSVIFPDGEEFKDATGTGLLFTLEGACCSYKIDKMTSTGETAMEFLLFALF